MNGNQFIDVALTTKQWRDAYRILNRDRTDQEEKHPKVNPIWQEHLIAIEDVCKAQQNTVSLPLAMTWPMSATIRQVNPELAEEISRQMNAQIVWSDCAESTEESFQMDIAPIESVLVPVIRFAFAKSPGQAALAVCEVERVKDRDLTVAAFEAMGVTK